MLSGRKGLYILKETATCPFCNNVACKHSVHVFKTQTGRLKDEASSLVHKNKNDHHGVAHIVSIKILKTGYKNLATKKCTRPRVKRGQISKPWSKDMPKKDSGKPLQCRRVWLWFCNQQRMTQNIGLHAHLVVEQQFMLRGIRKEHRIQSCSRTLQWRVFYHQGTPWVIQFDEDSKQEWVKGTKSSCISSIINQWKFSGNFPETN